MKKQEQQEREKRDTILSVRTFEVIKEKVDRAASDKNLSRNQYLEAIILTALENNQSEMALS